MKQTINGREIDVLILPIKKKWFDMILSGEKKEEYRDMTDYYKTRFINNGMLAPDNSLVHGAAITGVHRYIYFRNGYSGNSPHFTAECTLRIARGNPEWGAEEGRGYGRVYYTLDIIRVLDNPYKSIYEAQGVPFDEDKGVPIV